MVGDGGVYPECGHFRFFDSAPLRLRMTYSTKNLVDTHQSFDASKGNFLAPLFVYTGIRDASGVGGRDD